MPTPSARPTSFRAVPQPDGRFRWRLLAPNGRTLGLSADTFDQPDASWRHLLEIAAAAATLMPSYRHPNDEVGWAWSCSLPDGQLVAVGARSYERRATCMIGYQRFISVLEKLNAS